MLLYQYISLKTDMMVLEVMITYGAVSYDRVGITKNSQFSVYITSLPQESWHLKSLTTQLFVQQLVQANNKENIKPYYRPFLREIHCWAIDSPHKGPVTREKFAYHAVIIMSYSSQYWVTTPYEMYRGLLVSVLFELDYLLSKASYHPCFWGGGY